MFLRLCICMVWVLLFICALRRRRGWKGRIGFIRRGCRYVIKWLLTPDTRNNFSMKNIVKLCKSDFFYTKDLLSSIIVVLFGVSWKYLKLHYDIIIYNIFEQKILNIIKYSKSILNLRIFLIQNISDNYSISSFQIWLKD